MEKGFLNEIKLLMESEKTHIDVFKKFYSLSKLDHKNPYYEQKLQNFEKVKWSYESGAIITNTHPIRATVQTTDFCNLNCIMCQIHSQRDRHTLQSMKKDDFDTIVQELFPCLIEFHPTNIGEPLMSPWFGYLCEKIKEYGVLLDITTNGMLWTEEKILEVLPNLLDVKISFDGIKKETFERIRRGANIKKVLTTIDDFLQLREQTKSKCSITLQMTLFDFNCQELEDVIRFAAGKGIDRVKAFHVFSFSPEIDEYSLFKNLELFEQVRVKAIDLAEKLNVALEISEPKGTSDVLICQNCRLPWCEVFIDYDTTVYPCHSHNGNAYGKLQNQKWADIFDGDYARFLRNSILDGRTESICTNCGMNYLKYDENQEVPHNDGGYLFFDEQPSSGIRWSSRSRQFMLNR